MIRVLQAVLESPEGRRLRSVRNGARLHEAPLVCHLSDYSEGFVSRDFLA
jgi:hypothetical protein